MAEIKQKTRETLLRQWHLLHSIPRFPQKITAQALSERLRENGFDISERTIQRNLLELSEIFPLEVDDRNRPYGWSWLKDAKNFDLPGMTLDAALTWALAEQHITQMLPRSINDHLKPYFESARQLLEKEPRPHRSRSWLTKVRTVPPTQPLIPPAINADVQRTVSEALLHEYQLEVTYRRKGEEGNQNYRVHPLALIQRGSIIYLFARLFDYPNTRLLALHRIETATLLDTQPATAPDDFDLDNELQKGRLDFGSGEQIHIQLKFRNGRGDHLLETPLSHGQVTERNTHDPNTITVKGSVANTPQLKWWILGFGETVEVIEPTSLRMEIAQVASAMLSQYSTAQHPTDKQ